MLPWSLDSTSLSYSHPCPCSIPLVGHSINEGAQQFPVKTNHAKIISSASTGFGNYIINNKSL